MPKEMYTHYEGCYHDHLDCAVAEIERLQAQLTAQSPALDVLASLTMDDLHQVAQMFVEAARYWQQAQRDGDHADRPRYKQWAKDYEQKANAFCRLAAARCNQAVE